MDADAARIVEPTREYLGFVCQKCSETFPIAGPLDAEQIPPDKPMRIGAREPLKATCTHCGQTGEYAVRSLIRFSK